MRRRGPTLPTVNLGHPLCQGLVGWWMARPSMGTGPLMTDLLNRNHGALTNMDPATDWVATERGMVLDFDGSNDYVSLPNGSATHPTKPTSGTLEIVFTHQVGFGTGARLFANDDPGYVTNRWGIDLTISAGESAANKLLAFQYYTGGAVGSGASTRRSKTTTVTFPSGTLHHFVATWNSATNDIQVYKNGVVDTGSASGTGTSCAYSTATGSIGGISALPHVGSVNYVILSSTIASPAQAAQRYDQFMRGFPDMLNRQRRRVYSVPGGGPPPATNRRRRLLLCGRAA